MTRKIDNPNPLSPDTHLTCQQATDLIIDYVTDTMPTAMRAVFETHLRNCADCVAFLQTYRQTIRATHTLRAEDVPEEMLARVQHFLHARIKGTPEDTP